MLAFATALLATTSAAVAAAAAAAPTGTAAGNCSWLNIDANGTYWLVLPPNNTADFWTYPNCHGNSPLTGYTWSAVRIVGAPVAGDRSITINLTDSTFVTNGPICPGDSFGQVVSCVSPQPQGRINFDLVGTPFGLNNGASAWTVSGYDTANRISCEMPADGGATQHCGGLCGGMCGGCNLGNGNTTVFAVIDPATFDSCTQAYQVYQCANGQCVQSAVSHVPPLHPATVLARPPPPPPLSHPLSRSPPLSPSLSLSFYRFPVDLGA